MLEVAAGTGEHAVFLSAALPTLSWRPTDGDLAAVALIEARRQAEGGPNLLPALRLDAADPDAWPREVAEARFDLVLSANMIHISPWAAAEGLFAGAARVLAPGGLLALYGPFRETKVATAASNAAFDASLKARDPRWGLRDLSAVDGLAKQVGLTRIARAEMPANNLTIVYRRQV